MAFTNDISSAVAQYVYNQSNGNVVLPVNESYIQAYCEYLGITEPLNLSWLEALCNYLGITQPLHGSWTIALANYHGITYPTGGTWWMALANAGAPTPPTDLIWDTTATNWEAETTLWAPAPTSVTYRIDMRDTYGDGWTNNVSAVEIETSPGVWTSAGNIMYNPDVFAGIDGTNQFTLYNGGTSGPINIYFDLPIGVNARLVSTQLGDYVEECYYYLYQDSTQLLIYGPNASWTPGTVQYTFTT